MSSLPAKQNQPVVPSWVDLKSGVAGETRLWLRARREAALTALLEQGFPTSADEEWKYTSIARLHETPLRPADAGISILPHAGTDELGISLNGFELVFVNGYFQPELSRLDGLPAGVHVQSLAAALEDGDKRVETHLAASTALNKHPFAALNTLNMHDGAVISLDKGVVLEQPLHIHHIMNSPGGDVLAQPRNLIVAGENSRAVIVESYVGLPGQVYFCNAVTEVMLADSAGLDHYRLQNESEHAFHIAALLVQQGTRSYFHSHTVSLGAGLARYDVDVRQDAEGADCSIDGLYLAMGTQHVDYHLRVDHLKPHGSSRLLFKGVLDQKGRAVFNGKVVVHKGAAKTNADQTNKNLLLSREAEVDPKPELEIYHNDVKCSHGATVGQLDEQALFYLRSRGIPKNEARQMLTLAFAKEILVTIKLPRLEAYCECQLIQRLGGIKHE